MFGRISGGPLGRRGPRRRRARLDRRAGRSIFGPEPLEGRATPAVVATFSPGAGLLTVFGDALDNTIAVGRNAAGVLQVNGGAVAIRGGTATVANTTLIQIFGQAGNDTLALDEANGALPRANLFGGTGNDTLIGGSGADQLFGQAGNDTLLGRGGNDLLFGGADDDVLVGGDGDDQVFGESGNDLMIWNPGDDTDLNEGGLGTDTVQVNGGNGAEAFTVTANGLRVRFDRVDPAPFSLDIGSSEDLVVNMNGGADTFSATGNLAALIRITVDGGAGNDTILGSNGDDLLIGGDGDDFIDGQQGNDVALMGAGNDVFRWDPGDGSDVVEGQGGFDTMLFNGSGAAEIFDASANGGRVRFTRNVGNIVMDLDGVEAIDLNALGGADTIVVNDLSGTDLAQVNIDLAGILGGTAGDGQADAVVLNGTNGADFVSILGSASSYSVVGLPAFVSVRNSEGANDSLVVNGLGGNDFISASSLPAEAVRLTIDGGAGNDVLFGGRGADVLIGGDGDDFIDGNQGDDVALMGAGDDVFVWDPGDGSDVVEGGAGTDSMTFNGNNAAERIDLVANGGRFLLTRDVGNILMDTDDLERVTVNAFGGADAIAIGDLSGTDVNQIRISLIGGSGLANDGQQDRIAIAGTNGADVITAASAGGEVVVNGLPAQVRFTGIDAGLDLLQIDGRGGADVIDASGLQANLVGLTLLGGLGDDVLIGSPGDDLIVGGDGNDVALMGDGDDVFVWDPGDDDDVIEGQGGFDTMRFNGANVAEVIDISANGGRVRFFRNVANVTMDLNGVEGIDFNAFGGADTIVVNDLSGTDVVEVNLGLAAVGGGGDGQADTVIVNGTKGNDVILVFGDASGVAVVGLAAQVNVTGAESSRDRLVINALAGDDVVEASGLLAVAIALLVDGGDGDDVLIGGDGDDTLLGGLGDDVLIGGPGLDVLDGGPGDNVVIQ